MMQWIQKAVVWLLIAAAVLYVGDCSVFLLRGSPKQQLTISLFVSAPLKNNKVEMDYTGQEQWTCTRTLSPQFPFVKSQSLPCWYLRKHTNQVAEY